MHLKTRIFLLLLLAASLIFCQEMEQVNAETQTINFVGPVLLGNPIGKEVYLLEDVGSKRVWSISRGDNSLTSWAPDGCHLLLRSSTTGAYRVLSLQDSAITQILSPEEGGKLNGVTWNPDSRTITYGLYVSDSRTDIYETDLATRKTSLLVRLNEVAHPVRWESSSVLLYKTRDMLKTWNRSSNTFAVIEKLSTLANDLGSLVYWAKESPDRQLVAGFFDLPAYLEYMAYDEQNISAEEKAEISAVPQVPGFDVFRGRDREHVDVHGLFLQYLEWSQSSERLVLSTFPSTPENGFSGIYVYTLSTKVLSRVGTFASMRNSEYGAYAPDWSPDEQWLDFNTPNGYVLYHLADGKLIKLNSGFNGFVTYLEWSPRMDYGNRPCTG